MPFMEQTASYRLAEAETMLFPEFEHVAHGFFSGLLLGEIQLRGGSDSRLLNKQKDEFLHRHAVCDGLGEDPSFHFRLEV